MTTQIITTQIITTQRIVEKAKRRENIKKALSTAGCMDIVGTSVHNTSGRNTNIRIIIPSTTRKLDPHKIDQIPDWWGWMISIIY